MRVYVKVCDNCGTRRGIHKAICPICRWGFSHTEDEVRMECKRCGSTNLTIGVCQECSLPSGTTGYTTMPEHDERIAEKLQEIMGPESAWSSQVGGGHYKDMAIQPTEYCQRNELNAIESNIVKYASRHRDKNGREDIEKIIHYAKLLLELEYNER